MTPAILIELPIEGTPEVRVICGNSSEEDRVTDWILAHEELRLLVARALELRDEARAS